jgi:hypothetical protein
MRSVNFGATTGLLYLDTTGPFDIFPRLPQGVNLEIPRRQPHHTSFEIWYIFLSSRPSACTTLLCLLPGLYQVAIPGGRTSFMISILLLSFGGGVGGRFLVTTHDWG